MNARDPLLIKCGSGAPASQRGPTSITFAYCSPRAGCKIPLSLELLLPSCPPRLHGVAAKVTAQLAKSFTRVSKTLFEIFVHSGILTETGTHYVQICTLLPHLRQ
jgi:hypothetical protein